MQFAIDAAIDLPRFAILTPFPGTPLHQRLDREGRILTKNWELYDGQHVVFQPKQMTPRELQAGHERAWRERLLLSLDRAPARGIAHPAADRDHGQSRLPLLRPSPRDALHLRLADRLQGGGVMRLTLVHPAIGRRPGVDYMRTWQMEPLPIAVLAALTPKDVEIAFYDDRMEPIPFDRPTDLVAIPVETYTAKRAYQIASEYRRRGVPVVMGGFHATLMTDEVKEYAEAVVVGEAEDIWPQVIDDARAAGCSRSTAPTASPTSARCATTARSFAAGAICRIGLVETGRGCRFPCDFCAVQTFFQRTARHRPIDAIVAEIAALKPEKRLFFFVDDNFAADLAFARELAEALTPLGIRWVTQMSINAAHDEAFLAALARSGCRGVLIGFESLDENVLRAMRKTLQHHARRLCAGARQSAAPRHPRLRHVRLRL